MRPFGLLAGLGLALSLACPTSYADSPPLLVAPFEAAQAKTAQEAWAKHLDAKIELTNSLGMKLVLIPPGEFQMGGPFEEDVDSRFFEDNHHEHRVRITRPFYLGAQEVTLGQFLAFYRDAKYESRWKAQGKGKSSGVYRNEEKRLPDKQDFYDFADGETHVPWKWGHPSQTEKHPVVGVSWNDAVAFCEWLSRKEGKTYRLPSEAEWEYACRAGTATRFCNGDDEARLVEVANFADAAHLAQFLPASACALNDGFAFTAPVGKFKPNAFGLYDMHGNAAEWCRDWYDVDYFSQSPVDDPPGPGRGLFRVMRGGSWSNRWERCRSAARWTGAEWLRDCRNGFRVACEVQPEASQTKEASGAPR